MARFCEVALIASLLFVASIQIACASSDAGPNQGKESSAKQPRPAQEQEQQVPISVLRFFEAAFNEAQSTINKQAEAAAKQAGAYEETYQSPSVRIQEGLLIVGVLYSIFAALQWAAILKQAKLVVRLERPWIVVMPVRFEIEPKNASPVTPRSITFYYKVMNTGRSPAWLTAGRGDARKMSQEDLPKTPDYPEPFTYALTPKPPNEKATPEDPARLTFSPAEYNDLLNGKLDFIVRGAINYRSALTRWGKNTEHYTRYCFCITRSPVDGQLVMTFCGPPSYNEYT